MKKFFFISLLGAYGVGYAQNAPFKGRVLEEITQEAIQEAEVSYKGTKILTDAQGRFVLSVSEKTFTVIISKKGYQPDTFDVAAENAHAEYVFMLENTSAQMQAIEITASISKGRKTPVAFSNLSGREISERLGSADLPMLLNTTPGVYATQSGGGAGDSRINIRGFNQRNISVMIDGVPVNDMENGWVYWSNWFGLSEVTALTQVQRGLGNSRMANPAVGGTMNIVTRGVSDKFRVSVNSEMGDSKYRKYSATVNSGRLPGNFGIIASFTRRTSDGYVDKLYDDMMAFYFRVEKKIGSKHIFSLTAIGAPQSHGQRAYRARTSLYSTELAKKAGLDTTIAGMPSNMGNKYNQHWGTYYTLTEKNGDTLKSINQNERENMFFKPQYYLKHDFKPNNKWLVSSVVYLSTGKGGGTASVGVSQTPSVYGNFNFQNTYNQNAFGSAFVPNVDPLYDPVLKKSTGIIYRNVNNHKWLGLLSTAHYKINRNYTFTGGVDMRTYHAYHYREVYNLLGGDYYRPNNNEINPYHPAKIYVKGDKYRYNNDGLVRWAGTFGELEYAKSKFSAFVNTSFTETYYKRIDSFNLDSNKNPLNSGWENRAGFTVKSGLNYNISRKLNVYSNIGILDRPARFSNVFDSRNKLIVGTKNEMVYAWEAGSGYKKGPFQADANVYVTYWNNRPVDFLPTYQDPDGNTFTYNIGGLKALHMGVELAALYKFDFGLSVQTAMSFGDWRWKSGTRAIVQDDAGDSVGVVDFGAKNVHVGDAAQQQVSFTLRYEPRFLKNLYLSTQYVWFGKQYADFEPTALTGKFRNTESYRIPNYYYLNLSAGYNMKLGKNYLLTLYVNGQNITNNLYITDAQHRDQGSAEATFNPKNLEVFVSTGFRYTGGIRITYQ